MSVGLLIERLNKNMSFYNNEIKFKFNCKTNCTAFDQYNVDRQNKKECMSYDCLFIALGKFI